MMAGGSAVAPGPGIGIDMLMPSWQARDMAGAPPSLRAKQVEMSRELILNTVVDILERNGLEGLSMPAIAEASGVSLRTLYRYFPTRDDLLAEAGAQIKDRMGLSDAVAGAAEIPASFWVNSARAARHPRLARALIASSAGRSARKATRSSRVSAIEAAMRELTDGLPEGRAAEAVGVITYLCSSNSWVTISEETGVSSLTARRGVVWALETLLASLQEEARVDTKSRPAISSNRSGKDNEQ